MHGACSNGYVIITSHGMQQWLCHHYITRHAAVVMSSLHHTTCSNGYVIITSHGMQQWLCHHYIIQHAAMVMSSLHHTACSSGYVIITSHRFAHFFASPQLLKGCLDREIEAVDSGELCTVEPLLKDTPRTPLY